jgi:hypothetical protein
MNDWNDDIDPADPWGETAPERKPAAADSGNAPQHDPWSAPQQPYQAGDSYHGGSSLPQSTNGTLVLILGICSWLMCGFFTALPGWLIARGDRAMIQAGQMQPDSTLEAGYWINLISVVMTGVVFGLFAVIFFFSFVMALVG